MINKVILSETELKTYTANKSVAARAKGLLQQQLATWPEINKSFNTLEKVKTRSIDFGGFEIKLQFNPARIKSTTADIEKNIGESDSVLSSKNLPPLQRGIKYYKDYLILCNPYPIFNEHFTIPKIDVVPQSISNHFGDMLLLARDFQESYFVFYNGPKCGASFPNHMHFQAGLKNSLPIESEYNSIIKNNSEILLLEKNIMIYAAQKYLRNFIAIESGNRLEISNAFGMIYNSLKSLFNLTEEPLLNIISCYVDKAWRIIIFPRHLHRPNYYYRNDNKKLLVSPASIDMGGLMITPREEDFEKIDNETIADIYRQASIPNEFFDYLKKKLKSVFNKDK